MKVKLTLAQLRRLAALLDAPADKVLHDYIWSLLYAHMERRVAQRHRRLATHAAAGRTARVFQRALRTGV